MCNQGTNKIFFHFQMKKSRISLATSTQELLKRQFALKLLVAKEKEKKDNSEVQ